MKHLKEALESCKFEANYFKDNQIILETIDKSKFVKLEGNNISFQIQDGVISENGINGIQASDLIVFCKHLIESLDKAFPCPENHGTISYLTKAIDCQEKRTQDRLKRKVEGKNEI
jgi:hypothetical protein